MLVREAFQLQSSLWGSGLGPSLGATGKDPPAAASPACAQEPGRADARGTDYHHCAEGHPGTVTLGPPPGGRAKCPGTGAQSSAQALPPAPCPSRAAATQSGVLVSLGAPPRPP